MAPEEVRRFNGRPSSDVRIEQFAVQAAVGHETIDIANALTEPIAQRMPLWVGQLAVEIRMDQCGCAVVHCTSFHRATRASRHWRSSVRARLKSIPRRRR